MIVVYIIGCILLGLFLIYLILLFIGFYILNKNPLPFDEKALKNDGGKYAVTDNGRKVEYFVFGNLDVATVGSFIRDGGGQGLQGSLPLPQWEIFDKIPMNLATLKFIGPYALILAAIGLIESLMTLNLIDELIDKLNTTNIENIMQPTNLYLPNKDFVFKMSKEF